MNRVRKMHEEIKKGLHRGKIKVIQGNKIEVVTQICGEETTDWFTFKEIQDFIKKHKPKGVKMISMRPEIWDFAIEMENVMKKHDATKRDSWKICSMNYLFTKLLEEIDELKLERELNKVNNFRYKELVDVANMCMMIWNKSRGEK